MRRRVPEIGGLSILDTGIVQRLWFIDPWARDLTSASMLADQPLLLEAVVRHRMLDWLLTA